MTAIDRARLLHWNIDPCPKADRDPAGEIIAQSVREWNASAHKAYLAWKRLGEDVGLVK